jgi:hypothetical protein
MMPDPSESHATLPGAPPAGEPRTVACRKCRRPLRDAESRALGLGPECRTPEFAARQFDAEQEALPGF